MALPFGSTDLSADPSHDGPQGSDSTPPLWKVGVGMALAASLSYLTLRLLLSMVENLPAIPEDASRFAQSISLVVRYLLVGGVSLMAFMFAAVALGLLTYGLQLSLQKLSRS